MYELEELKYTKCNRCGYRSVIPAELPIEDSYCQCGGNNEYIGEDEYYLVNYYSEPIKEDLINQYKTNYDNYLKLAKTLKKELYDSIKPNVDKFRLEYRIKDFETFYEKIKRKYYNDPFEQMEDICGLRIICYYSADLPTISNIIKNQLEIIKSVDKTDLLLIDEFGYRSKHFTVKLKDEELSESNKDLINLKAEIQIRTLLMDTHASIEHHLTYKKGNYVPLNIQRRLSQVSATLEIIDEQFVYLREDLKQYHDENKRFIEETEFDITQELNITNFQSFLDFYLPDRHKIPVKTAELFDYITEYNKKNEDKITFKTLLESYSAVKVDLDDLERKSFAHRENEYIWHQSECLTQILEKVYPQFMNFFSA